MNKPTSKSTSKFTSKPTTTPTTKVNSKPTNKPINKPFWIPFIKPTGKPISKPTGKPTSKPNGKPTSKTTGKLTSKPTGKPTSKPTGKPKSKPNQFDKNNKQKDPKIKDNKKPNQNKALQWVGNIAKAIIGPPKLIMKDDNNKYEISKDFAKGEFKQKIKDTEYSTKAELTKKKGRTDLSVRLGEMTNSKDGKIKGQEYGASLGIINDGKKKGVEGSLDSKKTAGIGYKDGKKEITNTHTTENKLAGGITLDRKGNLEAKGGYEHSDTIITFICYLLKTLPGMLFNGRGKI